MLVEQELLTLPEQKSSPPVFSCIRVALSLDFYVVYSTSLFVFLSFCLLTLALSVLRSTTFVYSFGIFKLFMHMVNN